MTMAASIIPTNSTMQVELAPPPPQQEPPLTFTLFSKLPYDMRRQIWNETFEGSRRVKIEVSLDVTSCSLQVKYKYDTQRKSTYDALPNTQPPFSSTTTATASRKKSIEGSLRMLTLRPQSTLTLERIQFASCSQNQSRPCFRIP